MDLVDLAKLVGGEILANDITNVHALKIRMPLERFKFSKDTVFNNDGCG